MPALKTVGMVAQRLSQRNCRSSSGKSFVARLNILLGAEEQPLAAPPPLPDLMAEQRFAEPIVTQDTIAASSAAAWPGP